MDKHPFSPPESTEVSAEELQSYQQGLIERLDQLQNNDSWFSFPYCIRLAYLSTTVMAFVAIAMAEQQDEPLYIIRGSAFLLLMVFYYMIHTISAADVEYQVELRDAIADPILLRRRLMAQKLKHS